MIYAKTFCNPGSYVEVVPCGLLAKIQYNKDGILEKILVGPDFSDELPKQQFHTLSSLIPSTITLKNGTTWVEGVFYTSKIPLSTGYLHSATQKSYIDNVDSTYTFYAGKVDSKVATFSGIAATKSWLNINKFNTLPGIIVPLNMTESTMQMLMSSGQYSFNYPYIAGYYIFEGNEDGRFTPSNILQYTVVSTKTFLGQDGALLDEVEVEDMDDSWIINHSDVVAYNLQSGVTFLYQTNGSSYEVLTSRYQGNMKLQPLSSVVTCPVCKKRYNIPVTGRCYCDDANCLSKLYNEAVKMLRVFKLPPLSYDTYKKLVKSKEIICVPDILDTDVYKDIEVRASLSDVLAAIVPVDVCVQSSVFDHIAECANHSADTLLYYLNNTVRMQTDMDMNDPKFRSLINWLNIPYNISNIQQLLARVTIINKGKTWDIGPVYRGRTFVLTGKFISGDTDYVTALIEGCGARVVDNVLNNVVDCVIVGGTHENISGKILKEAKMRQVLVLEEEEFMAQYNKLLSENLL